MTVKRDAAATGSKRRRSHRSADSRTPWPLAVLAAVASTIFVVPLIGLIGSAPWRDLPNLIADEIVVDAIGLSLVSSLVAAMLSVILGVPLAWVLSRSRFPGQRLLRAVVTLPMVLPPVVGGAALLFALGRRGIIGEPLAEATGFVLPFSLWGVIVANTFVAMPFLVVTVEGAFDSVDRRYEAAAATLGANRFTVFRRISLPMIAPSLRAGLVLAWARALGEFGATITFAGNLSGRTQTLPLAVFVALEADRPRALAISLLLVVVSIVVLVTLRDQWWRR